MKNKQRGLLTVAIFVLSTVLISACTQSLSVAPAATATAIAPELFVSPLPSAENPMAMIEEFAKQTSVAQTAAASTGATATPQAMGTSTTGTPEASVTGTPGTPTNVGETAPADAITPTTVVATPTGPTPTATAVGVRPATYTLQNGEFPYCIARRFNVDPQALLKASGLTSSSVYEPGLTLTIPQSGSFPGDRMLASHPTTYTVASANESLYSIACKYGDVDPAAIAAANSIAVSAKLTTGQTLQIP